MSVVGTTTVYAPPGLGGWEPGTTVLWTMERDTPAHRPAACTLRMGPSLEALLSGGDSSDSIAPADEQSFNSLVVGNRFQYSLFFTWISCRPGARSTLLDGLLGSYTYASTGSDTGTLTLTFDGGGSCTYLLRAPSFRRKRRARHSRTCTSAYRRGKAPGRLPQPITLPPVLVVGKPLCLYEPQGSAIPNTQSLR